MTQNANNVHKLPVREDDYLGPARVIAVDGQWVTVETRSSDRRRAELALQMRYAPAVDDVLLVIGRASDWYVIGVLAGAGQTDLVFQGGVTVRAEGGPLNLSSDRAVNIAGPELDIETGKMQVFAGAVVERFTSLYKRVKDALDVHAGRSHTIVDEGSFLTAKTASIVTEGTASINGDEIHLG